MTTWEKKNVRFHRLGKSWVCEPAIEAIEPALVAGGSLVHLASGQCIRVTSMTPDQIMDRLAPKGDPS